MCLCVLLCSSLWVLAAKERFFPPRTQSVGIPNHQSSHPTCRWTCQTPAFCKMHPSPSNALNGVSLPIAFYITNTCTLIKDPWPLTTGCVDMYTFICISWYCAAATDTVLRPSAPPARWAHLSTHSPSVLPRSRPKASESGRGSHCLVLRHRCKQRIKHPIWHMIHHSWVWWILSPGQVTPRLCVGQFFLQFVHSRALSSAWQPLQGHDASSAAWLTEWVCVTPEAPAAWDCHSPMGNPRHLWKDHPPMQQ